jgi:hypothetical protein
MARILGAAALAASPTVREMRAVPRPAQPAQQLRTSSVQLRVAPAREPASFVAWAQEQVSHEAAPSDEVRQLEQQLVTALRNRDAAQALTAASVLVYECPDHEVARRIKVRCAQQLRGATRAMPRPEAIPRMRIPWHELGGRNLAQRAAFLLSCIDGVSTVEQLIDVSAFSPLVAYDILDVLVRDGIVELT